VYDPDCDNLDSDIFGCFDGKNASCNETGQCQYQYLVPEEWVCDPEVYNASDGCDCDCGAYDPDCNNYDSIVFNCDTDEICLPYGNCSTFYSYVPANWTCSSENYNNSDGCDCNCGAYDPDCATSNEVFNCPCTNMSCNYEYCVGSCNGFLLTAVEEKSKNSSVIEGNSKNIAINGWTVAFGTLLSLNVISVVIIALYRKHRTSTNDNRTYVLLENK